MHFPTATVALLACSSAVALPVNSPIGTDVNTNEASKIKDALNTIIDGDDAFHPKYQPNANPPKHNAMMPTDGAGAEPSPPHERHIKRFFPTDIILFFLGPIIASLTRD